MFIFPDTLARTLFQYPASREVIFATQIFRFVGGQEQRYDLGGAPLRRWPLRPTLITDKAMAELTSFYEEVGGTARAFAFTDPWDGAKYPVCYFESDRFDNYLLAQGRNAISFTILEGR